MATTARPYRRGLCWLRRDLRLGDNRALAQACRACERVAVVFVFDTHILDSLSCRRDRRVVFIHECLGELDQVLESAGSALLWRHGVPESLIPETAAALQAEAVFANEDYEPYAKGRDARVAAALAKAGIQFHSFKDQVIFSSREVVKRDGSPYRVFTPYKRAWLGALGEDAVREARADMARLWPRRALKVAHPLTLRAIGFEGAPVGVAAGATAAQQRLRHFLRHLDDYQSRRDRPDLDATSRLSVHLRFGTLSIRRCVGAALKRNSGGARTWLNELIWREFFQMVLDRFPGVEHEAFVPKYRGIRWPGGKAHFAAWCEGRSGYPIVDAGMRQLNETGWMHNRLRMITAGFLVKDLLVNWQWGERYFAEKLLDFDLAANNGGWQWCASTGCDAQPYFRIFNPVSQSRRFDPNGVFIRRNVPELRDLPDSEIHMPVNPPKGYPPPIVDHRLQHEFALALFKDRAG